jgi:dienelactone hydrolase
LPHSSSRALSSTNDLRASRGRRLAIAITGFVLVIMLIVQLPPVRTVLITASLVPQMLDLGFAPLSAVTQEPTRETVTYGTPADRMDVYLPAGAKPGAKLPAVVLALGVHPAPIDDPSIVKLASAIARAGVVVGVPDSTALRELRVTPQEPAHLADAALALANRPEVDGTRIGLAGFSAGASMALDAAADPRLAGHLDFVSSFGAYADAERLLVDVASRTTLNPDGTVAPWQPDPGIRHDVLELAIQALPDDGQRDLLRNTLQPVVDSPDGQHVIVDLAQPFEGDAQHVFDLFTATDRSGALAAAYALSPELRAQLAGISPVTYASQVNVPVYLLHGVTDTAIPVAHAALLQSALGSRVQRLTEFGRFGHGQPGANGLTLDDAGDIMQLALYLRDVVAAATE